MATPSTSRPPLREITTPNTRPLAPIFTLSKRRANALPSSSSSPPECFHLRTPPQSSPLKHIASRKRARKEESDIDEEDDALGKIIVNGLGRRTARSRREVERYVAPAKLAACVEPVEVEAPKDAPGVHRRSRRRGLACEAVDVQEFSRGLRTGDRTLSYRATHMSDAYLPNLTHNLLSPHSFLRIPSVRSPNGHPRDFAPTLACTMSWAAKLLPTPTDFTGPKRLLAVASEEGTVSVVDVDRELRGDVDEDGAVYGGGVGTGLARTSPFLDLHQSTIFDIKWSGDDRRLLTMSGDQTSSLHDLSGSTPKLLASLHGHTSSVKAGVFFDPSRSAAFDPTCLPSTVIATAGRDGNINIYDLRCKGWALPDAPMTRSGSAEANEGPVVMPVATLKNAHGQHGKRGSALARTATRSVTSLLALEGMPGTLASGGSFDGVVKLWDIRFPSATSSRSSAASSKPPASHALLSLPDPTIRAGRRQRAINCLNEDPTTGDIFALAGDSRIHVMSPTAGCCYSQTFTHPALFVSSFYIKSSLSRDGRYLAAGSGRGGVVTWDVGKGKAGGEVQGTFLKASVPQCEIGSVEWGLDILASSGDDLSTRLWRPNPDAARAIREDPSAAAWKWIGASQ